MGESPGSTGLTVRLLRADEAVALVACIRRCYTDSYVDPDLYDAAEVARRMGSGRQRSIAALTSAGEVVGHMALSMRRPEDLTADAGMTLVEPEHRGRGIAHRVALELAREALRGGLVGAHDYPVTVHGATQRLGRGVGVDTGLLIDNLPARVRFNEMEDTAAGGRSASLIRYLPFAEARQREVHVPSQHRAVLEGLYTRAGLVRRFAVAGRVRADARSELTAHFDASRAVLRIVVDAIGHDIQDRVRERIREAPQRPHAVHLDLSLADPATPAAVKSLGAIGFFYAGLLPEYRDGDVLRLQRIEGGLERWSAPVLSTDLAREIVGFVVAEARAANP